MVNTINDLYDITHFYKGLDLFVNYLSHYPLANIIFTWIGSSLWIYRDTPLSVKLLLAASVLLYAWILSLLTEKHTARVGKYVSRFIFPNKHQSIKREVIEKVPS